MRLQETLVGSIGNKGSPINPAAFNNDSAFEDCFPQRNCFRQQLFGSHDQENAYPYKSSKKRKCKPVAEQRSKRDLIRSSVVKDLAAAAEAYRDELVSHNSSFLAVAYIFLVIKVCGRTCNKSHKQQHMFCCPKVPMYRIGQRCVDRHEKVYECV